MLPANPEIDRQTALHAPIVLHEERAVSLPLRAVRIDIETAAGGQAQQEGSKILPEWRGGRVIVRSSGPVRAVGEAAVGGAMRVSAIAIVADVGAELGAVIAADLHNAGEDLINVE